MIRSIDFNRRHRRIQPDAPPLSTARQRQRTHHRYREDADHNTAAAPGTDQSVRRCKHVPRLETRGGAGRSRFNPVLLWLTRHQFCSSLAPSILPFPQTRHSFGHGQLRNTQDARVAHLARASRLLRALNWDRRILSGRARCAMSSSTSSFASSSAPPVDFLMI